mgnify:CR=1 FL=1
MFSSLKAKFFLFLIAINWASLIILFFPFIVFTYLYDKKTTPKVSWLNALFLVHDYFTNVILGGHSMTYVSSVLGYMQSRSRTGHYAATVVNWLFYFAKNEVNHCENSMKPTDVYDFSARRAIGGTAAYWLSLFITYNYLTLLG